jgi:hypothetical protein
MNGPGCRECHSDVGDPIRNRVVTKRSPGNGSARTNTATQLDGELNGGTEEGGVQRWQRFMPRSRTRAMWVDAGLLLCGFKPGLLLSEVRPHGPASNAVRKNFATWRSTCAVGLAHLQIVFHSLFGTVQTARLLTDIKHPTRGCRIPHRSAIRNYVKGNKQIISRSSPPQRYLIVSPSVTAEWFRVSE